MLAGCGCRVSVCTEPEQAIDMALAEGVDLVSLDIGMPRLNGFEVLSLIRSHEHTRRAPSVPVIAITGKVSDRDRAEVLALGFAAHLAKPVLLSGLRPVVERVQTLRGDLYRTRYSIDQMEIGARLDSLLGGAGGDSSAAIAGLALAIEQQATGRLRQMLESAYAGDRSAVVDSAARLAEVGEAIGARHLAALCHGLAPTSLTGIADFERQAALVRAELDRVIFTLRERFLP